MLVIIPETFEHIKKAGFDKEKDPVAIVLTPEKKLKGL